jgi:hypothetical protein
MYRSYNWRYNCLLRDAGDINIAEPGALIGLLGAEVKETQPVKIYQKQTALFYLSMVS